MGAGIAPRGPAVGGSATYARHAAGYAAVALADATPYGVAAKPARQLRTATAGRAVIEQAKGIVMGRRRCGPVEAFRILTRISQGSDRKLLDVATALVAEAQHDADR